MMIAQVVTPIVSSSSSLADVLPAESPRERFERLRDSARREVQSGRLREALDLLGRALGVARAIEDPRLEARAECNLAAVAIALGEISDHLPRLRVILMRNHGAETSFAAAYNLARAFSLQKDHKKSVFYARIARDRALAAENDDLLAKSHIQLGLSLLSESHFPEACEHFEKSISLLDSDSGGLSASPSIGLGYCLIVTGRVRPGMGLLYGALRLLRRHADSRFQSWAHLFLASGHLELGRVRHAWLHVRKALRLAEASGEQDAIKNALFLLGEVESVAGDTAAAYTCFQKVQQRFFPEYEDDDYAALLSVVGTSRMVNLGA